MMTPLKWIAPAILLILFILGISYSSSIQNIGLNTTSEIEALADTINVGTIRKELDEDGNVEGVFFDKEELIANLTAKIVEVQKNHQYDIKLDYLFLDKDKNVTNVDEDIRSIQFRLQYVDKKGEVKASTERHLAVNVLNNGGD